MKSKMVPHRYLVIIHAADTPRIRENVRRQLKQQLNEEYIKVKVRSLKTSDRIVEEPS